MLTPHPTLRASFPAYSVLADSLDALLDALTPPCRRFVLLVAADVTEWSNDDLCGWAGEALDRGASCAGCWGPDAARLETAFDRAGCDRETDEIRADGVSVVMTTSHVNQSLRDAAWFALHAAYPAGVFEVGTGAVVLAVVRNRDWYADLSDYIDDGAPIQDAVQRSVLATKIRRATIRPSATWVGVMVPTSGVWASLRLTGYEIVRLAA
jgi:hypothetical protein